MWVLQLIVNAALSFLREIQLGFPRENPTALQLMRNPILQDSFFHTCLFSRLCCPVHLRTNSNLSCQTVKITQSDSFLQRKPEIAQYFKSFTLCSQRGTSHISDCDLRMRWLKSAKPPRSGVTGLAVTVVHILLQLQSVDLDNMHCLKRKIGLDFIAFTSQEILPELKIHFMLLLKISF